MNKDLHDIDELFRAGLEGHEETPSPGVKNALDAALDKKEATEYKKRFILWKRAALLLLLLLAGFVLYESGIIKTGGGRHTVKNTPVPENDIYTNKNESAHQNKNTPVNSNNESVESDNIVNQKKSTEEQQKQQQITSVSENPVVVTNISPAKTIVPSKNNWQNKRANLFTKKQDPLFSITSSKPDKTINVVPDYGTSLQADARGIEPLGGRAAIAKVAERLVKKISTLQPVAVSLSPLAANKAKDSKKKKTRSFRPFWMITSFASYDQAGYRLDSDEPSAITSIKFREAYEPSFSLGLLMTRQIVPRWGLQSGLVYSISAIGMKPQKTYAFVDPTGDVAYKYITSSGYAYIKPGFGPQPAVGDSLTTAEAKHTIEHISIPLAVKYTVPGKKISITTGAGVEANFITKANLEVDIEDPFNREIVVVRKLNGTKSFYWSFVADAEIRYKVNQKLSINIRPVYRTAISPITKNNVVETFPHSFGIGAGVTIKF
ncbi:MAG: hypothetical protein ACT4OJ_03045 [Bacteroidota bacterium]